MFITSYFLSLLYPLALIQLLDFPWTSNSSIITPSGRSTMMSFYSLLRTIVFLRERRSSWKMMFALILLAKVNLESWVLHKVRSMLKNRESTVLVEWSKSGRAFSLLPQRHHWIRKASYTTHSGWVWRQISWILIHPIRTILIWFSRLRIQLLRWSSI